MSRMERAPRTTRLRPDVLLASSWLLLLAGAPALRAQPAPTLVERDVLRPVSTLLDLSGLAWVGGDVFVAVHDTKNDPDEGSRARVSLVTLPHGPQGVLARKLNARFPDAPSNDLESAARIPGTGLFLFAESTDDQPENPLARRIFLARVTERGNLRILGVTSWPAMSTFNVEATAVARLGGGRFVFLWAERAQGEPSTDVMSAPLDLDPFSIAFEEATSVELALPPEHRDLYNRPIVSLDVDRDGRIYAVAAFDPDVDAGPFRSALYDIGRVDAGGVVLRGEPLALAVFDGFKVESVAVRDAAGGLVELFVGTDDEDYGATLRPVPPLP